MNILLLGSNGQVGFELLHSLSILGKIYSPLRQEVDLNDTQQINLMLEQFQPDLIVNAAAWTAVDAAENQQNEAFQLNAELPKILAQYAHKNNIPLIHYSSDYVYPGDGQIPWLESSKTNPLSIYGQSKLAGDQAIINSNTSYLIFRTSWVYSTRGHNFMKTMLKLGKEKEALSIINDQVGSPTPARLIADITLLAIRQLLEGRMMSGIYHLAPKETTTWRDFACEIFRIAKELKQDLKININNIKPIPTSEYPTPAQRPLNSRLKTNKIENALNIQLPNWKSQLELTLRKYIE